MALECSSPHAEVRSFDRIQAPFRSISSTASLPDMSLSDCSVDDSDGSKMKDAEEWANDAKSEIEVGKRDSVGSNSPLDPWPALLQSAGENDSSPSTQEDGCESKASRSKRVSFQAVEIRTYPVILGDHPDCSVGPPLTIDWEYNDEKTIPLDIYERTRRRRRHSHELEIPSYSRRQTLKLASGCSNREIHDAVMQGCKIRKQRDWSSRTYALRNVQDVYESVGRVVTRVARRGKGRP